MAIRKKLVIFPAENSDPGSLHIVNILLKITLPLCIDLAILLDCDRIYHNLEATFSPFLTRFTELLKEHPSFTQQSSAFGIQPNATDPYSTSLKLSPLLPKRPLQSDQRVLQNSRLSLSDLNNAFIHTNK